MYFICPHCNNGFQSKRNLTNHIDKKVCLKYKYVHILEESKHIDIHIDSKTHELKQKIKDNMKNYWILDELNDYPTMQHTFGIYGDLVGDKYIEDVINEYDKESFNEMLNDKNIIMILKRKNLLLIFNLK